MTFETFLSRHVMPSRLQLPPIFTSAVQSKGIYDVLKVVSLNQSLLKNGRTIGLPHSIRGTCDILLKIPP